MRNVVKLLSLKTLAVAVSVVGSVLFFSCNKEPEEIGAMAGINSLQDFEDYTPVASTLEEKLLLFTNYVNVPNEFPMPDMELKEAIWFMESFFNFGICEKQKQFVRRAQLKNSYSINIPFIISTNMKEIILRGNELQMAYRNVLKDITMELLPEYALNFADVYVISVDAGNITVGIDVMYGSKKQKSDEEELEEMDVFDFVGRYKIISPNWLVNSPFGMTPNIIGGMDLMLSYGTEGYRDYYMEAVLNNEVVYYTLTSVKKYNRWKWGNNYPSIEQRCDGSGAAQGSCDCPLEEIHVHGKYSPCQISNKSISLTKSEYTYYGKKYRNYIYAHLCGDIPAGYSPFLAGCKYRYNMEVGEWSRGQLAHQDFALEYICQFGDWATFICKESVIFLDPVAVQYLDIKAM